MNRKILSDLIAWKSKKNRKPLLLTGVRQCGKTYIINEFGNTQFENYAYFNFETDETLCSIFEYDFNVNRIINELSAVSGNKIEAERTLVCFDEIQVCPRAVTALKYFCEQMRELHIIAAGSLLGVALRTEGISFPVGKINMMQMYPMDFEEFVLANGGDEIIAAIKDMPLDREIPLAFTVQMERLLKSYYVIGGMPEVVSEWITNHSYDTVEEIQNEIISGYANDFAKHAPTSDIPKLSMIWNSIPTQLAKENNKFVFSHVKKSARAKDLEDALQWLVDAGLIYKQCLTENVEIPLSGTMDTTYFKVFMADVGLLSRRAGLNYRNIFGKDELYWRYKGAIAENFVQSQLSSMGIENSFWRSSANADVDFLVEYNGCIIPLEVKSANRTKAKSLGLFCKRYKPKTAIKMSLKNVGDNYIDDTRLWSVPLYCIFKLEKYLSNK